MIVLIFYETDKLKPLGRCEKTSKLKPQLMDLGLKSISAMKKGSKLNSILTGSCPKCQSENMYWDKNPFHVSSVLKMHEKCSHCGLKYQIEPSFFYGAMYVSYGLNVAVGIAAFIISYLFFNSSLKTSFIAIIVTLTILFPIILRVARNIYINIFVSYDPMANNKDT